MRDLVLANCIIPNKLCIGSMTTGHAYKYEIPYTDDIYEYEIPSSVG